MRKMYSLITSLLVLSCLFSCCIGQGEKVEEATIIEIIDGDTYDLVLEGGNLIRVRLIGIDTPEIFRENDSSEWNGVNADLLNYWGHEATEYAKSNYLGKNVGLVWDPICGEKDDYGRSLYYLELDGTLINRELVELGYARAYRDYDCQMKDELSKSENNAISKKRGVWSEMYGDEESGVFIAFINYDALGNDNENLNDEYVILKNNSQESINLEGWKLKDYSGNVIYLEGFIDPMSVIKVFSGCGEGPGIYSCKRMAIWNNDGDVAYLHNGKEIIDSYQYGDL